MGFVRIALAVAALAAITACSGPVTAVPASYYLALGDSLSRGVQPDMAGADVETRQGYADQLWAALRSGHPGLQLVKFGCPGETTGTMINGGICRYPGGSQLAAAAAAFLRARRGHLFLITIDIGANDPEDCGSWASLSKIASCFGTGVPRAAANLATIMTRLRAAAGPSVRIVGMSYYLPALGARLGGGSGHDAALPVWTGCGCSPPLATYTSQPVVPGQRVRQGAQHEDEEAGLVHPYPAEHVRPPR